MLSERITVHNMATRISGMNQPLRLNHLEQLDVLGIKHANC